VPLQRETLFTGFVRDLTERRETERRLQQAHAELVHVARQQEMGQMASSIAHEINQPLAAAANYLGAARRFVGDSSPEATGRTIGLIEKAETQTRRASEIVDRLRAFLKRREVQKRPERLRPIVEEAMAIALIGVREREIEVGMAVDPAGSDVIVDKVQVQQVLVNLIRNAVEAMATSERRELVISAESGNGMVEVKVGDTGPGLSAEIRSRLFQAFVTTKERGMGVGLSISRSIVEAHGGELSASDNPGGGTVFRFTLPVAAETADGCPGGAEEGRSAEKVTSEGAYRDSQEDAEGCR
jgi:two-component system sensor kinase FixL